MAVDDRTLKSPFNSRAIAQWAQLPQMRTVYSAQGNYTPGQYDAFGGDYSQVFANRSVPQYPFSSGQMPAGSRTAGNGQPQLPANNTQSSGINANTNAVAKPGEAGAAGASFGGGNWLGMASGMMGGITTIINNTKELASIADTSQQWNTIKDIGNVGQYGYSNYGQILNDYDLYNLQPNLNYDDIRGGSTGERVGLVAQNTLEGFMAGAQTGNPWVAIGGAAVGLGAGIGGWLTGDEKARLEKTMLTQDTSRAKNIGYRNISAGIDNLQDYTFRNSLRNIAKEGGKMTTVKDFANRVLSKGKSNDATRSSGIIRERVDGGVKIKIKR